MSKLFPLTLKNMLVDLIELDKKLDKIDDAENVAAAAEARARAAGKAVEAANARLSEIALESAAMVKRSENNVAEAAMLAKLAIEQQQQMAKAETAKAVKSNLDIIAQQELTIVAQGAKAKELYDYCAQMEAVKVDKQSELLMLEEKITKARETIATLLGK
jgi:hypothetical protein